MNINQTDILEGNISKDIMDILLRDHTTQRNIFWATNDYEQWVLEEWYNQKNNFYSNITYTSNIFKKPLLRRTGYIT